ncbi:MAG: O-antigen ligase family protein [Planctomycetota bacterium]
MDVAILIGTCLALFVAMLFFPWLAMAMLLSVPIVKAAAEYYVPIFQTVDLTLLTCAIAGAMGLWNLIRRPGQGAPFSFPWKPFFYLLILGVVLLVGVAWTTAPYYGTRKALRFLGIGIPFLVLPSFLVRSKKDGRGMFYMTIGVGLLSAIGVLVLPETFLSQATYGRGYFRGTFLGSSPIMAGVMSAVGILCLLCGFIVRGGMPGVIRFGSLLMLPVSLAAILKTGTRSSLAGLLITLLFLPILAGRRTRVASLFLVMLGIPIAVAAGYVYVESQTSRTAERWSRVTEGAGAESLVSGRAEHYRFCLQNWYKKPILGHGCGSFAMDGAGRDEQAYPHNIVLEAMYEAGSVGTIALLAFIWVIARTGFKGLRLAQTPQDRLLILAPFFLTLMFLIQGMIHWDLDGVRFLYLFAGLLYANVQQVAYTSELLPNHVERSASSWPRRRSAWAT